MMGLSFRIFVVILFVASLVLASGCQPSESTTPRVDLIAPSLAYQQSEVNLYGVNLGEWDDGVASKIFVNGVCADPVIWSSSRVTFIVPPGIGTGLRKVEVFTSGGHHIEATIDVQGPDRPLAPKWCSQTSGPITVDPDAVTDSPDTSDTPDGDDVPDVPDVPDLVDVPDVPDVPDLVDVPDVPFPGSYYYVLISDMSGIIEDSPGVDVDSVILRKGDGAVYFASEVREYASASSHPFQDPFACLEGPDAFYAYPDVSVCLGFKGFTSLGGSGGYLIVAMPVPIVAADVIEVLEVGNCLDDAGRTSPLEAYQVSISTEPWFEGNFWFPVGFSSGGPISLAIPDLP